MIRAAQQRVWSSPHRLASRRLDTLDKKNRGAGRAAASPSHGTSSALYVAVRAPRASAASGEREGCVSRLIDAVARHLRASSSVDAWVTPASHAGAGTAQALKVVVYKPRATVLSAPRVLQGHARLGPELVAAPPAWLHEDIVTGGCSTKTVELNEGPLETLNGAGDCIAAPHSSGFVEQSAQTLSRRSLDN